MNTIGCVGKHQQEDHKKAYINLYTRHIASSLSTKAEASIRVGDSLQSAQPVEFPRGISFHGVPMAKKDLPNRIIRYNADRDEQLENPLVFRFVDIENNNQEVYANLSGPEEFSLSNNRLDLNATNDLVWSGEDLKENERFILIFTDPKGKSLIVNVNGPTTDQTAVVPTEEIMSFEEGPLKVYLVKKSETKRSLGCNDIELTTEFYTDSQEIDLVAKR